MEWTRRQLHRWFGTGNQQHSELTGADPNIHLASWGSSQRSAGQKLEVRDPFTAAMAALADTWNAGLTFGLRAAVDLKRAMEAHGLGGPSSGA